MPTERLVAILKSSDVKRTVEWYTRAGFDVRGSHPEGMPTWCEVGRDGTVFQFLAGETPWEGEPSLTGAYASQRTTSMLSTRRSANKINCEWGIEEREWGARELVLRDPDGYFITFTQ